MPKHDLPDGPKVPSIEFPREPMQIVQPPLPITPISALSKALHHVLELCGPTYVLRYPKEGEYHEPVKDVSPFIVMAEKLVHALISVTVPQPLPELDPAAAALSQPGAVYLDTYRGVSINVEPYKNQWRVSFICNEIADSITSADRNIAIVTAKRRIDAILDPPVSV